MDRRKALLNLGILTGGMVLLPSCDFTKEQVSLSLNKLRITASEEALMKELVSSIIPEGKISGAASLHIHDFVWVMVDDCMDQENQSMFLNGLKGFDSYVKKITGNPFSSLDQKEREEMLLMIINKPQESSNGDLEALKLFVSTTKEFTSFGYMKSEYIMTEVMPYTLIPGSYGPCETVDKTKRINVNG